MQPWNNSTDCKIITCTLHIQKNGTLKYNLVSLSSFAPEWLGVIKMMKREEMKIKTIKDYEDYFNSMPIDSV